MKSPGDMLRKAALALTFGLLVSAGTAANAYDNNSTSEIQNQADEQAVVSTEQKSNGHKWIKARILIRACPHVVWDTVHEERKRDPDLAYSKVLSEEKNQATLEQKFALIPVIGTAVCVMQNTEVPYERIDYNMIRSDRFKAMEGSWVISPGRDGNTTYLELASYCDLGLPVPRPMIDGVTAKKLQRRLTNVKKMAEATQMRLAHTNKVE